MGHVLTAEPMEAPPPSPHILHWDKPTTVRWVSAYGRACGSTSHSPHTYYHWDKPTTVRSVSAYSRACGSTLHPPHTYYTGTTHHSKMGQCLQQSLWKHPPHTYYTGINLPQSDGSVLTAELVEAPPTLPTHTTVTINLTQSDGSVLTAEPVEVPPYILHWDKPTTVRWVSAYSRACGSTLPTPHPHILH